jgi:hypothetical protein
MKKKLNYKTLNLVTHQQAVQRAAPLQATYEEVANMYALQRHNRFFICARPLPGHDIPSGHLPPEPAVSQAAGNHKQPSADAAAAAASVTFMASTKGTAPAAATEDTQSSPQAEQVQPASDNSSSVDGESFIQREEAAEGFGMMCSPTAAQQKLADAASKAEAFTALAVAEADTDSSYPCGSIYQVSGLCAAPGKAERMEHLYAYQLLDGFTHLSMRGASRTSMLSHIARVLQSVEFKELWGSLSCKPQHMLLVSAATSMVYYHPLVAFFILRRLFPALDVATLDLFAG